MIWFRQTVGEFLLQTEKIVLVCLFVKLSNNRINILQKKDWFPDV